MIRINDKSCCSACGACVAKCNKNAISFKADGFGNRYPIVDENKCVHCDICNAVCPLENELGFKTNLKSYAVRCRDRELINSASGGAFYGMAKAFLEKTDGVVYGCAYDNTMTPIIIGVSTVNELYKLQGSKYVISLISNDVYKEIETYLKEGRKVLFSGVPCQCSAIRQYNSNHNNLYTIELLCHGFIDVDYWKDYILILKNKHRSDIADFQFRNKDKKNFVAKYVTKYVDRKGRVNYKSFYTNPSTSYYYYYFLGGKIFRENCYKCKFAQIKRASDITIGDYWGYNGCIDSTKGVSALMVFSKKGNELLDYSRCYFELEESDYDDIAKNNGQLNKPTAISLKDYSILSEWKEKGAEFQYNNHRRHHIKAHIAAAFGLFR